MNETTSEAPLTATVGERLRGDPHLDEARKAAEAGGRRAGREASGRRPGGEATGRRPFPWGALALGVIGWAFATAIGRRVRRRARRMLEKATALGHGARRLARR
jgi:hypothetical protein